MKIKVYHREPFAHSDGPLVHVANVEFEGEGEPLEFAWERTQNIDGSWSREQFIGSQRNLDWHPSVERLAPLPEHNGRLYGLRSSSVGDVFVIDAEAWKVASVGFEPFEGEVPA